MKNSPLIEIIAEVRWGPGNPHEQSLFLGSSDANFIKFGVEAAKMGYSQVERTQPEGFPSVGGQVLFRYRKAEGAQNTLYQLGHGVFTANGLKPYSSWREFSPVVESGIEAISRAGVLPDDGPRWLVLKYVDAFEQRHLGEMPEEEFLTKIIGVSYLRPSASEKFPTGALNSTFRFQSGRQSLVDKSLFSIDVGKGMVGQSQAVVMNTTLISGELEGSSPDAFMEQFRLLQELAHDAFEEMIKRDDGLFNRLNGDVS